MRSNPRPLLVAIVGGSGSGKSWLAAQLQTRLGPKAVRLSLDDFYRDRSHLTPARRARINFDHPRAIEWPRVEQALGDCAAGRATTIPRYDFQTHSQQPLPQILRPGPVILVEGLWLLHRPKIRRWFDVGIFIDCPLATRLNRRLARDTVRRGRSRESARRQFRTTVEPMHKKHVAPQQQWADIRLQSPVSTARVRRLAAELLARWESNL